MNRTRGITAALLAAGLALVGCSSGSDSADYTAEAPHDYDSAVDADAEAAEHAGDAPVPAQTGTGAPVREVITTAEVSIVVADPVDSATEVVHLVETTGGRVDQRTVRAEHTSSDGNSDRPASAHLTVRIPAADLDGFLVELEQVGEIGEVTQSAEDVTQAAQDLDARIEALQTSTDRLLEIMAQADDTEDLIAIEQALSQRQAELESLRSQRAYLSDQVALSTVHLTLTAEQDPVIEASGFTGGLQTGWHALLTFVAAILAFSGMMLPWLIVLGIPAAVIIWTVRRRRHRRGSSAGQPAMTYAVQAPTGTTPSSTGQSAPAPAAQPAPSSTPPTGPAQSSPSPSDPSTPHREDNP